MYEAMWDADTGGVLLTSDLSPDNIRIEIRPVFYEELDLLGLDQDWSYPKSEEPLLWATSGRRYFYRGRLVAETRGGGFFEKPQIVTYEENLSLTPIDIRGMVEKNSRLMEGLEQKAIEFIHNTYKKYSRKVDVTAVAFSGGKDSLVLLDLVQKALSPDQFVVVFADTTMELSPTYEAVEKAKLRWPKLNFQTARCHKDALTTWKEFGPPSRILRWCCTVHKSAPTLLLLRHLTNKASLKALVFDGVRCSESTGRSGREKVAHGGKHKPQINARPILNWFASEVFAYIFWRGLEWNAAYRFGNSRVGCSLCPFSSQSNDFINTHEYFSEIKPFSDLVLSMNKLGDEENSTQHMYLRTGQWKSRSGGHNLDHAVTKVITNDEPDQLTFHLLDPKAKWQDWIGVLGPVSLETASVGTISIGSHEFRFDQVLMNNAQKVIVTGFQGLRPSYKSLFRALAKKTAHCIGCGACVVECPTGALKLDQKIGVQKDLCVHCHNCLTFTEMGCVLAKSLKCREGGVRMKGLDRYNTFGIRSNWIEGFFLNPGDWWHDNTLGKKQYEAMKVWLTEAEILKGAEITELGRILQRSGSRNLLTWAIIWTNLAWNSRVVRWYIENIPWNSLVDKKDLIVRIANGSPKRTEVNAIGALVGTLRDTPIGNQLGIGVVHTRGKAISHIEKTPWKDPDCLAVLYSIYRFAERTDKYNLTVSEIVENASFGPHALFGLDETTLTHCLRRLSSDNSAFLGVELVKGLDNINLNPERKSEDVLTLAFN